MPLKVGGLFAGYAGIEVALASVLDVEPAWFAEFEDAPSRVLAHRFPGVPNLGDVTKVDWSAVEPVDIITGGSPCQDLSHAGKRAGMKAGTRSGLWASMCDAIDIIRPRLVVWENVRGALSAEADSELEPCPGCVGDGDDGPVLRALGRVLGDLAELGYDARWYGLRAADVGGAHGRFRIFLFATPADARSGGWGEGTGRRAGPDAPSSGWEAGRVGRHPLLGVAGSDSLTLLPTPAVNDMGAGKTVDAWDAWTERMRASHGNGNGHGKSLAIEALRLMPMPTVDDAGNVTRDSGAFQSLTRTAVSLLPTPSAEHRDRSTATATAKLDGSRDFRDLGSVAELNRWGDYAPAIARAEALFAHRPAPAPTEPGAKGGHRLSPAFVEWLMGLPAGWVVDVPGITRNQALKALGNGVVPQQCAAALRAYLTDTAREAIA